jgi:hypothetical protein
LVSQRHIEGTSNRGDKPNTIANHTDALVVVQTLDKSLGSHISSLSINRINYTGFFAIVKWLCCCIFATLTKSN